MNFNFGAPKTTGGLTFSTPTSSQVSSSGLTFAAGDNKSLNATDTGNKSFNLSFGATANSPFQLPLSTPSTTAPLTFGNITPQTTFNISSQPSITTSTIAPQNTFNLSTQPQPTTAAATFGSVAPQTTFNISSQPSTTTVTFGSIAPQTNFSASSQPSTSTLSTFSLGITSTQTTTASLFSGTVTTTSAPTINFNLGSTATTTSLTGTPISSSSVANTFSLGKVDASTTSIVSTVTPSLTSTTTTSAVGTQPVNFTFGQLEEVLNKWNLELDEQGKMFINQALQLNAWDRLVNSNSDKLVNLNQGIENIKQQQQLLDQELHLVSAQQKELEELIVPLEKELKDISVSDLDRNNTYEMAENLDMQLKQMSEDLKEIIEHLNDSSKSEDNNDPVAQIGRILNAHMNSLQWIDRSTAQMNTFLNQITKMHEMHRRDNERSFHLTYE